MPLNPKLLDVLACPKCKGGLEYREKEDRLLCAKCRLAYEVREGIPVMLVEEAKKY